MRFKLCDNKFHNAVVTGNLTLRCRSNTGPQLQRRHNVTTALQYPPKCALRRSVVAAVLQCHSVVATPLRRCKHPPKCAPATNPLPAHQNGAYESRASSYAPSYHSAQDLWSKTSFCSVFVGCSLGLGLLVSVTWRS